MSVMNEPGMSVYDGTQIRVRRNSKKCTEGSSGPALNNVNHRAVTAILHIPGSYYDTVAWSVKLKDHSPICTVEFMRPRRL